MGRMPNWRNSSQFSINNAFYFKRVLTWRGLTWRVATGLGCSLWGTNPRTNRRTSPSLSFTDLLPAVRQQILFFVCRLLRLWARGSGIGSTQVVIYLPPWKKKYPYTLLKIFRWVYCLTHTRILLNKSAFLDAKVSNSKKKNPSIIIMQNWLRNSCFVAMNIFYGSFVLTHRNWLLNS